MTTLLHQLEVGAKSAEEVQEKLDEKIINCYGSFQRLSKPMENTPIVNTATMGMFDIFKLCFLDDLVRLGLEKGGDG